MSDDEKRQLLDGVSELKKLAEKTDLALNGPYGHPEEGALAILHLVVSDLYNPKQPQQGYIFRIQELEKREQERVGEKNEKSWMVVKVGAVCALVSIPGAAFFTWLFETLKHTPK